ncbi:MAG: GH25 family lysozyme [Ginsengibacter sp.]
MISAGFIIAFIVINLFFIKPHIFYPGFEINMPTGYEIHGIDVSRYQSTINWKEVKEMEIDGIKIGFAFIKATEGEKNTDPLFKKNWRRAGAQNITKGAYHFYIPGTSPERQAKNFSEMVSLQKGDLPPVLDIEISRHVTVSQMQADVKRWLQIIENHYGVKPIIYTNISFYETYFNSGFEEYPIWIAHYLQQLQPRTNRHWIFWQHSEQGRVNGIRGKVDFNVFYGDSSDFRAVLIGSEL